MKVLTHNIAEKKDTITNNSRKDYNRATLEGTGNTEEGEILFV